MKKNEASLPKIVLINTFAQGGGAALACKRLYEALQKTNQVTVKHLTQTSKPFGYYPNWGRFLYERLFFLPYERNATARFAFSPAVIGAPLHTHPFIKDADIIHLHWFHFGFLSIEALEKLAKLNKPIVWTLHDMWAFTGGCHYASTCTHFEEECGNCHLLRRPHQQDLSHRRWQKKMAIFEKIKHWRWVACSQWLRNTAQKSSIGQFLTQKNPHFRILDIPNPLDTTLFHPYPTAEVRQRWQLPIHKKLILFAAANLQDPRKGYHYFQKALEAIAQTQPNTLQEWAVVMFGKLPPKTDIQLPYPIHHLGMLQGAQTLAEAYSAADVFVLPSLEDNLPNTLMESMACGTPAVAFRTGGIPEMMQHQEEGYLADYQSIEDLAKGILYTLSMPKTVQGEKARQKVMVSYNEENITQQYIKVYNELLSDVVAY